MRVLLIAPCRKGQRWKGKRRSRFLWPPMALMILAAETPKGVEVVLADEATGPIPFDEPWDLVGISAITASATRAFEIADAFRERKVPVILGGIHPSFRPEEALEHAAHIGYPVVLKASAGGGGRGIRVVEKAAELADAFESADAYDVICRA